MDELELIKSKVNIVDLIQEYLPLKKAGVNFKANCPFHQEKTPSFMVSPERGIFHCFGCNVGGDIFKFLMLKEGIEFPEALEILAKKAGITLKRQRSKVKSQKDALFEINSKASEFFHYILVRHPLGKTALDYLKKRGLTDETVLAFKLGYAPNSWDSLSKFLTKRGFKLKDMIEAGLLVPSQKGGYDRFRGRIIFPLIDVKNNTLGFAGRVLGSQEPKYINTPTTKIFDKSHFLFGLHLSKGEIKQKTMAILVEGEMDMIISYQSGVKNIAASKGTALTEGQVELIKKYAEDILLCFDKDLAGDFASRRGIELADQAGLNIKVIELKNGKDPAEIAIKDPHLWEKAIDEAEPIYDYYLKSTVSRYNPKSADGKRKISQDLIPIWKKITDPLTKEHYIQKLAALLAVEEKFIRHEISSYQPPQPSKIISENPNPKILETQTSSPTLSRRELLEEYLLALLLKIPSEVTFVPNFPETIFISENLRSIYVLLVLYLDAISFKVQAFSILEFSKTMPEDLLPLLDRLYLVEVDYKLTNSQAWLSEVDKVVSELKKALVKASLEKLSFRIKNAQMFGKISELDILNKKFRDLSLKLKSL